MKYPSVPALVRPAYWRSVARVVRAPSLWSVRRLDHAIVAATRAAVAVGVPLLAGVLAHRPDLAALAPYGAFTAIYGRGQPYGRRAVTMAVAGLAVTVAMAVGALLGAAGVSHWLAAVVIAVGTLLTTLVLDMVRSGPPGGFIMALTMLSASAMPMTWTQLPVAVGVTGATAVFGWCLVMAGRLVRPLGPVRMAVAHALEAVARYAGTPEDARHRHQAAAAVEQAWEAMADEPDVDGLAALTARAETVFTRLCHGRGAASRAVELPALAAGVRRFGPAPTVASTADERVEILGRRPVAPPGRPWRAFRPSSPEFLRATRSGTGVLLAYWAALALGLGHAYWAALAAAAALQAINLATAVQRAFHRVTGSVLGALLAAAVLAAHLPALGLAAVAIGAMFVIESVIASNYALALVFITTLIAVLLSMVEPVSMVPLLTDRVVATAFGAAVGALCGLLVVNTRYAELLDAAVDRCSLAQRELTLHWAMGATARLRADRNRVRANLLDLRDILDLASGEPSHVDLSVERVLTVERHGYQALARTAATPFDSPPRPRDPYPDDPHAADRFGPSPCRLERHGGVRDSQRYLAPPRPQAVKEPTYNPSAHSPQPAVRPGTAPPPERLPEPPREPAPEARCGPEPAAVASHPERNGNGTGPRASSRPTEHPVEKATDGAANLDVRDRLLRVLLADPGWTLHAVGDLEASRTQLDRLNDSVSYQRRHLVDAARRLRGAGLTPAQVAQLAGLGEGELVSLLAEHSPFPRPRSSGHPDAH